MEIVRHKIIVEKCEELIEFVSKQDEMTVNVIMEKSKAAINKYNEEKLTICNPTKSELGKWSLAIKSIVNARLVKPLLYPDEAFAWRFDDFFCCDCRNVKFTLENYWDMPADEFGNNLLKKHYEIYEDGADEYLFVLESLCHDCRAKYLDHIKYLDNCKKENEAIKNEFSKACNNTIFSEDLMLKHIYIMRNYGCYNTDPIIVSVKETIKTKILQTFVEQNQELLTKFKTK